MKKNLLNHGRSVALCATVMTACAVAHAAGSVTLYGVVDTGFEWVNNTPASTGGRASVFRAVSGSRSGSRWGFRGNEDLGGGNSAFFVLENGFGSTDGTFGQSTAGLGKGASTTTREFGRMAYVGIGHSGQKLMLGRQQSLPYDYAGIYDPMAVATRYSLYSLDPLLALRADNSIKYAGAFGPVTLNAMYSTRYDTGYGSEVPGAELTGREFSFGATYANGPLAAGIVYEQLNSNTVATNTASQRRLEVGAAWQAGRAKVYGGYRYLRTDSGFLPAFPVAAPDGGRALYGNLYWLGLNYQITPAWSVTGAAYYEDFLHTKADPLLLTAVTNYALSKRTDLYVTGAFARNSHGSTLGVNGFGTVAAGANQVAINCGLRHRF
ncbi:porin [Burkholderia multivorans]|uniref:porin n=1 Tax=Burkholderia multivorans TaxID=87883 RepID=UPI001C2465F1|nr:porin [Burkholderia multivorans]MBU9363452.1 porin [Burkholderia multivorans]